MDGVLADFERGVKEFCGITPPSQNSGPDPREDDAMWDAIRTFPHFYDHLELMPGARDLFDALYSKYGNACEILTGIPKPHRQIVDAASDKKRWMKRLLSEDVIVNIVFREEKPRFCHGAGSVLIDDTERNIHAWRALGGTGILYVDAQDTMAQLKGLCLL